MEKELTLPSAYDAEREENKLLQRLKKKAAKSFSFTRMSGLYDSHDLARHLYLSGRTDEALEVCELLAQVEFSGNFNVWSPVETTLALYARILKERGRASDAVKVMDRVRAAGFVEARLSGDLLSDDEIRSAAAEGDRTSEAGYRCAQLSELCFMKELGGSRKKTPEKIEALIQENLAALKTLLKI